MLVYADISGLTPDHSMALQARRTEIEFFKRRGVYAKVIREPWMKILSAKWLDVKKGDESNPNIRSRLVRVELAKHKRDHLFEATPPLECLKMIISLCASTPGYRIMATDVKRAYFYAKATRPIFVHIPGEDWVPGDEAKVAKHNRSLYGTRDAAFNWANTYSELLLVSGFERGRGSSYHFLDLKKGLAVTVHGNNFTSYGTTADIAWLKGQFEGKFEVTTEVLGPEKNQAREIRVLHRILRRTDVGIEYEPDQRRAEIVIQDRVLESAKVKKFSAPGAKEDLNKASALERVTCVEESKEFEVLGAAAATYYREII